MLQLSHNIHTDLFFNKSKKALKMKQTKKRFILENLNEIIQRLSENRPVFFNESDFQFSLAEELNKYLIEKQLFSFQIILEFKNYAERGLVSGEEGEELVDQNEKRRQYIDIIILDKENNKYYPIELKYKTIPIVNNPKLKYHDLNVSFDLAKQGAQNLGCAYFLQDIQRLTLLKNYNVVLFGEYTYEKGFAIFITNDKAYWERAAKGAFKNLWLKDGSIEKEVYFTDSTEVTRKLYKKYQPNVNVEEEKYYKKFPIFKFENEISIKWTPYSGSNPDTFFAKLIVEI